MSRATENTGMNNAGMNEDIAMDATDLTQLSSREQLSALMDGALPADETRFLLRRLQHDDSLAECWQRWRLSAEVMRGLAPTQQLPSDFAARVAASLRGDELNVTGLSKIASTGKTAARSSAWLRWSGGAAMAASLAVVAFMTQPTGPESPGSLPDNTIVAATSAAPSITSDAVAVGSAPAPSTPAPKAPAQAPASPGFESQTAAMASAVAFMAKPLRNHRRAGVQARVMQSTQMLAAGNEVRATPLETSVAVGSIQTLMPQSGLATRPWPRSVLPQYGNAGMSVGFGESTRSSAPYNPFQVRSQISNLPTKLIGHLDGQADKPPAGDHNEDGQAAASGSESPPRP